MAGRACLQALLRRRASSFIMPNNNNLVVQCRTIFFAAVIQDGSCKLLAPNNFRLSNGAASRELLFDPSRNAQRWMSSGRFSDEDPPPRLWLSEGRGIDGEVREVGGERDEVEVVEVDDAAEDDAADPERPPPSALDLMLQGVPRRRQRFLMEKALKIKAEGEDEERASRRGFEMKVIDVNRTVKVTKGGKVQSFAALVITGNYEGVVGFGKGKSSEIGPAIDKASLKALNNLHYFERFQGHTIFHEHDSKFEKTRIYLWPGRSGTGMRASHTVGGILRLAGFKNVKSKVVGSRHPLNTVKAVFKTLSEIESPEEVGERRGRIVVESHLVTDSS